MPSRKTVFILGAGASAHAGVPVIADFIGRVRDIEDRQQGGVFQQDFTRIVDLIRGPLTRIPAARRVNLHNVEEVFSLIEMGRLVRRLSDVKPGDLEQFALSMKRVIAHTVDFSCQFPVDPEEGLMAPVGYEQLAMFTSDRVRNPERRYSFITFNYDIALDVALEGIGTQFDYGLQDSIPGTRVPVLKLHGSINWQRQGGTVYAKPVSELLQRARNIGRKLHSHVSLQALHPPPPGGVDPALVPPSWNKSQDRAAFGTIWQHAAEELASAESIVIIGYSAPQSDAFFSDLLAIGLASASKSLRRILLIDKSDILASRYAQEILGSDTRSIFAWKVIAFETWAAKLEAERPDWSL